MFGRSTIVKGLCPGAAAGASAVARGLMRARTCAGVPLGACITLPGPPPIGMFWGPVGASIVLPGPPPIGGAPLYAVVAPPPPEVPPPGTMPVGDCIVMPGPPPIGAVPIGGTAPTGTEGPPAASAAGTGEGLLSGFGARLTLSAVAAFAELTGLAFCITRIIEACAAAGRPASHCPNPFGSPPAPGPPAPALLTSSNLQRDARPVEAKEQLSDERPALRRRARHARPSRLRRPSPRSRRNVRVALRQPCRDPARRLR